MTLLDLLGALDRRGINLGITPAGRLRTNAPTGAITPELAAEIRANRSYLEWTVIGRQTGHTWAPCNACGEVLLIAPGPRLTGKTVWPACVMTPGCPGRHTLTHKSEGANP